MKHWAVSVTLVVHAENREDAQSAVETLLDELQYDGEPLHNAFQQADSTEETTADEMCPRCKEMKP